MTKINTGGPAYPSESEWKDGREAWPASFGMTKREVAAIAALQGILAGDWANHKLSGLSPNVLARDAVEYADALIAELGDDQ